jgi:cyclopropane-fatty-acyl-phospholipid synthase
MSRMRLAEVLGSALGGAEGVAFRAYDGSVAGAKDPVGVIEIRSPLALRYVVASPGDLGLARAYVAGALEVHGDLYETLLGLDRAHAGNLDRDQKLTVLKAAGGLAAVRRPPIPPEELTGARVLRGRRHSKRRDAAAISHHYDVSNQFYSWLLGPSMAYTCACFPNEEASLEQAQAEKFDLVARKLRLQPGMRLLDVGCGWGGMVLHAAREYGVHALGVTLSQKQAEWAQQAIRDAGVSELAEVRFQDYRDVTESGFDAVSSIGLTEHIGLAQLPSYFGFLRSRLRDEGLLLNHCITRPTSTERVRARGFIDHYIFPDGELEAVGTVASAMQDNGFEIRHSENLREHYAMTLRDWGANLEKHWAESVDEVGLGRARVWKLYLAMSRLGFSSRRIELHQVLGVRVGPDGTAGVPLRPWF